MTLNDICLNINGIYYDVVHGVDGWVVYGPKGCYTMSGLNNPNSPSRDGWDTRQAAYEFCKILIDSDSKKE